MRQFVADRLEKARIQKEQESAVVDGADTNGDLEPIPKRKKLDISAFRMVGFNIVLDYNFKNLG